MRPIESFHKTFIHQIDANGTTVHFEDGRTFDADLIVFATGYKQSFPFLDDKIKQEHRTNRTDFKMNQADHEYAVQEDYLPSEHFIVSKTRPGLGFIGFVRPNVGAIPPMSELQIMWWLCNLEGRIHRLDIPNDRLPSYMVLGHKYRYGVDYGNYMHRVAEDINAAPTLSVLARSSKPFTALYVYCQGQSHIPIFRLQGPFASKQCWQVTTEELWQVCVKRGFLENFGLASVTWLSLWMNLGACFVECLWGLVSLRKPQFFTRYG